LWNLLFNTSLTLKFYYGWKAPISPHWNSIHHPKTCVEHLLYASQHPQSLGHNSEENRENSYSQRAFIFVLLASHLKIWWKVISHAFCNRCYLRKIMCFRVVKLVILVGNLIFCVLRVRLMKDEDHGLVLNIKDKYHSFSKYAFT